MTELRRLLDIQLRINHAGRVTQLLDENKVQEALAEAEKAASYAPNNPDLQLNLGFIAYLAGEREKALNAFRRAKQLAPDFQKAWEAMSERPAYKKITEDREFVDKVIKELRP
jgi:tetratricopeptide (TPR) repeat protein